MKLLSTTTKLVIVALLAALIVSLFIMRPTTPTTPGTPGICNTTNYPVCYL